MDNHEKLLEMKENARFAADISLTKQYYQGIAMLWTKGKYVAFILILVASAACLWTGIWISDLTNICLAFIYFALGMYLLFGLPAIRAKRSFEISVANYSTVCEIRYLFTDEMIISENVTAGGLTSFTYNKIRLLKKTRSAYAFFMEKSLVFYIPFESLKEGTGAEFEAFITQKCPNAKNKL